MKKRDIVSRISTLAMCLVLLCSMLGATAFAAEGYEPDGAVAVFATDRHDNATIIGEVLAAVTADGYAPGLVALGGDLVGGGPDIESNDNYAPVVDSAFVAAEIWAALSKDVSVAILEASHDRNMTDSASIMVETASGFTSGEFNVFIIPEAYMSDAAEAQKGAEAFLAWAQSDEVDANKPLVVLSHMPMHYLREDNPGGYTWHQALNTVASAGGEEVVRNVMFFHGHNHTVDSEEYYHPVGTSLAIQGAAEEEQYEEIINYTYMTAGYLDQNGDATVLRVEDEQIIVDKYSADGGENLGSIARLKPVAESNPLIYAGIVAVAVIAVLVLLVAMHKKSKQKQA